MPADKRVFHSFAELLEVKRFEKSKTKGRQKPQKLPPAPKQPVLTSHESKPKQKGRVNSRARSR